MSAMAEMWQTWPTRARVGMVLGGVLILGLAAWLGIWAYRTEYGVLFADLSNGDASAMVAELERVKTPYQLADDGHTILVPRDLVYKTRLKVMGKELPLHGAVGFEVFNNADFGMTEFVQKVNYQRAVQGELTRTILSIEDVQSARVHLAIPEQGLFKKTQAKAKASVTLVMKPGRTLAQEQVAGIARLVAASVPDISPSDVTLLDQHGVSLTKAVSADGVVESAGSQLDSKRSVEDYLLKKVAQVLDNMFGSGVAMASVDVVLNLDSDKTTTEDVLPAQHGTVDGTPTGVVVRERQINQGGAAAPAAVPGTPGAPAGAGGNTTVESDYQVGRRVQQVSITPGGTRRMTVAVVIKKSLTLAQLEHVKEVVSLSLGLNPLRGDAIVVQSMDQLLNSATSPMVRLDALPVVADAVPSPAVSPAVSPVMDPKTSTGGAAPNAGELGLMGEKYRPLWLLAGLLLFALLLSTALLLWQRTRRQKPAQRFGPAMSQAERDRLLGEIRQWIVADGPGGKI